MGQEKQCPVVGTDEVIEVDPETTDSLPQETMLKEALTLTGLGWSVIPVHRPLVGGGCACGKAQCDAPGKHPAISWKRYQTETPRLEEVQQWFAHHPCNLGVVTGPVSGLLVVDADGAQGEATPAALARAGYPLPEGGPRVRTGGGGQHIYLRYPNRRVQGTVRLLPGVDLRSDGNFVVVPPSLHASGRLYEWITPPDAPLPEAPEWLLDLIEGLETAGMYRNLGKGKTIPEGSRNSTLASWAGSMRRVGMSEELMRAVLMAINATLCTPPLPDKEVETIAHSIARYEPATEPDEVQLLGQSEEPILLWANEIQPEEVKWLWYPYVPYGKITILEGHPGVGKTWLALQIVAAASQGLTLPDQNGNPSVQVPQSKCLYLTAEDGLGDTLVPRLQAMGANLQNVAVLQGWRQKDKKGHYVERPITLQDVGLIEAALKESSAKVVVVDPLQAYLGPKVDMNNAADTRPVLAAIARLAEKYEVAVILIRHFSKTARETAALRGLGSVDISGAARSVLAVIADPQDRQTKILAHSKHNLNIEGTSLRYRIENGQFVWAGTSSATADELLSTTAQSSDEEQLEMQEAKDFLLQALADGMRRVPDLKAEAKTAELSWYSVQKAAAALGVLKKRVSFGNTGKGYWEWRLPDAEKHPDASAPSSCGSCQDPRNDGHSGKIAWDDLTSSCGEWLGKPRARKNRKNSRGLSLVPLLVEEHDQVAESQL